MKIYLPFATILVKEPGVRHIGLFLVLINFKDGTCFKLFEGEHDRYKILLEKELARGKFLLKEIYKEIDIKQISKKINHCIKRMTDFL